MVLPLNNINPGDTVQIVYLAGKGPMQGRLLDLGFAPGAQVSCVLSRKKRNLAAYLVRGAVIALRAEDSRLIFAKETGTQNGGNL